MRNDGEMKSHPTKSGTKTNEWNIFLALLAGSFTGGFLISIGAALYDFSNLTTTTDYFRTFGAIIVASFMTIPLWFLGIVVFGAIPWLFLHKIGCAKWYMSILVGFCIPYLLLLGLSPQLALMFGFVGCPVGWVVWRIAYWK